MILKCVVPRCAFGEIKWIRTENHEVYALVSSQNDYPSLDNEKRSQKNLSNTNETNANSTEEFTSRFYANTPMTIVLELVFPSVRYSQAGKWSFGAISSRHQRTPHFRFPPYSRHLFRNLRLLSVIGRLEVEK